MDAILPLSINGPQTPKGATSEMDEISEPLIEKGCEVNYAMVLGRTRVSGSPNYSG